MSRGRRRTWGTHVPQRPCSHSPYRGPLAVPRCICATIGPRSSNARAPTALTRTLPTLPVVLRTLPQLQCPCTHCLHLLTFPLAPRSHPPRSCSAPARTAPTSLPTPPCCGPYPPLPPAAAVPPHAPLPLDYPHPRALCPPIPSPPAAAVPPHAPLPLPRGARGGVCPGGGHAGEAAGQGAGRTAELHTGPDAVSKAEGMGGCVFGRRALQNNVKGNVPCKDW